MNAGGGDTHVTAHFDLGDYRHWYDEEDKGGQQSWLNRPGSSPTSTNKFDHSLAGHAWYCIRKANLGLENLDKMTDATKEEKNFIKGQLLFFRGWFHFELMQFFGGLPYIDYVLPANEKMTLPRLSYSECAEKAAKDFREAADLLPVDWDDTKTGSETLGNNDLRITKLACLGYLGKDLLWAGRPFHRRSVQRCINHNSSISGQPDHAHAHRGYSGALLGWHYCNRKGSGCQGLRGSREERGQHHGHSRCSGRQRGQLHGRCCIRRLHG